MSQTGRPATVVGGGDKLQVPFGGPRTDELYEAVRKAAVGMRQREGELFQQKWTPPTDASASEATNVWLQVDGLAFAKDVAERQFGVKFSPKALAWGASALAAAEFRAGLATLDLPVHTLTAFCNGLFDARRVSFFTWPEVPACGLANTVASHYVAEEFVVEALKDAERAPTPALDKLLRDYFLPEGASGRELGAVYGYFGGIFINGSPDHVLVSRSGAPLTIAPASPAWRAPLTDELLR
jgi:hypothetical protein